MTATWLLGLFALFLPVLLFLLFYSVISISFVKLGFSRLAVFFLFVAIIVGAFVNIPIWHGEALDAGGFFRMGRNVFFRPPQVETVIVAINVGGALIPLLMSLYILPRAPLLRTLAATVIVTGVAYWFASVVPGVGITMHPLIAPLTATLCALVLGWKRAAPIAFVSGTIGTLIGADLLHLQEIISASGGTYLSIGGAGVMDGIFLVGVIAAFLSPGAVNPSRASSRTA